MNRKPAPSMLRSLFGLFILTSACTQLFAQSTKSDVLDYLKTLGNGKYLFGQVATWVHNENPDMDDENNWVRKVYEKTGQLPRLGVITYDFEDNPFSDSEWNQGVKKMFDNGMLAAIYSWYDNPSGNPWNGPVDIDKIFDASDNPVKTNFYQQMDRMAANIKWLEDQGIPVIYTPFVELDDSNKWHTKGGREAGIRLYRLVHDYFTNEKKLANIIWAYHTTQRQNALPDHYPGDAYVDILGKSAYGTGLIFTEYEWAVDRKKNHGKVIWWAELGVRGKDDEPRDCLDVLRKLNDSFPELAGFVFWSDAGYYNVVGNQNGKELMANPQIVTATK
ncbi:MAG: glycoside hydrolase family 26 protein [Cyclobacteriaceae bacterium]|nr:glycoside hydrolase family 26 protein [Cyclobacteriaceae bacterium]